MPAAKTLRERWLAVHPWHGRYGTRRRMVHPGPGGPAVRSLRPRLRPRYCQERVRRLSENDARRCPRALFPGGVGGCGPVPIAGFQSRTPRASRSGQCAGFRPVARSVPAGPGARAATGRRCNRQFPSVRKWRGRFREIRDPGFATIRRLLGKQCEWSSVLPRVDSGWVESGVEPAPLRQMPRQQIRTGCLSPSLATHNGTPPGSGCDPEARVAGASLLPPDPESANRPLQPAVFFHLATNRSTRQFRKKRGGSADPKNPKTEFRPRWS